MLTEWGRGAWVKLIQKEMGVATGKLAGYDLSEFGQRWVCGAERCRCGSMAPVQVTPKHSNLISVPLLPCWETVGRKGAESISGSGLQSLPKATKRAAHKFSEWHAVNQGSVPREDAWEGYRRTGKFLQEGELGDFWTKGASWKNERISANKLSHTQPSLQSLPPLRETWLVR